MVYYIKQVHYDYWLSSAIPVIFVLCDPNTGILYWQQIKLSKVSATPTGHKLVVSKKHLLNKESLNSTTLELQLLEMVIAVSCVCV